MSILAQGLQEKEGIIERVEEIGKSLYKYSINIGSSTFPSFCYAIRIGVYGEDLTRPYSPIRISDQTVECIIKIYPASDKNKKMLTPLLKDLSVNDRVRIVWYTKKHPIENILSNKIDQICMISAGTGITPMMQILEHSNTVKVPHKFISIALSSDSDSVILKNSQEYPFIKTKITDILVGKKDNARKYAIDRVEHTLTQILSENKPVLFLVCGPDSFVQEIAGERKGLFGGILHKMSVHESMCVKF